MARRRRRGRNLEDDEDNAVTPDEIGEIELEAVVLIHLRRHLHELRAHPRNSMIPPSAARSGPRFRDHYRMAQAQVPYWRMNRPHKGSLLPQ